MTDRETWLSERRKGIGGSDVAAILGLNPYRTAVDVYNDKLGLVQEDISNKPAVYWGIKLEQEVSSEFQLRTKMKVQRVNHMFHDPEEPWMLANIDRAIINPEIQKNVRVIEDPEKIKAANGRLMTTDIAFEAKTCSSYKRDEWGDSQESEILSGKILTEHEIPLYYETQIQWYCGILHLRGMYLSVLLGGQDYRMYWIPARPDVFEVIKEKCKAFWYENVLKEIPPEPVSLEDVAKLYGKSEPTSIEADELLAVDYGELVRLDSEMKLLKKQSDELKERIGIAMKENEVLTLGGKKVLTYKTQVSSRFDTTTFKAQRPQDYLAFVKKTETRVMRICK